MTTKNTGDKQIQALIKTHQTEAQEVKEQAEQYEIKTHDGYGVAAEVLLDVKSRLKLLTEKKEGFTKPAREIIAAANSLFAGVEQAYEDTEKILKRKLADYLLACEEARYAQLRKAQSVAKIDPQKARKLVAGAEALSAPPVSGVSVRAKFEYEILDEEKIPEEYFVRTVDEDKLLAALKAGEDVPGVIVKQAVTLAVTPSKAAK